MLECVSAWLSLLFEIQSRLSGGKVAQFNAYYKYIFKYRAPRFKVGFYYIVFNYSRVGDCLILDIFKALLLQKNLLYITF